MVQTTENPLTMQETQVQFLGQEDCLEKSTATHSSILAWETPWSPMGYSPQGHKELDTTAQLTHTQPALPVFPDCSVDHT